MEQTKLDQIAAMMREFQVSLRAATSSDNNPPEVTSSLSILESAFKMFREMVTGELESIRESLSRVNDLEERLESQEQYSRRNCLLVRGIPESSSKPENEEECLAHVMRVIKNDLKLSLKSDVISRCHRLGGRGRENPRDRPIIIKFYSYKHRREVFDAKKQLQGKPHSICEFLTIQRLKILRAARQKHSMRNVWTSDGKILINVAPAGSNTRKVVVVRKLEDIPPASVQSQPALVVPIDTKPPAKQRTPNAPDAPIKTRELRSASKESKD